MPMQAIHRPNRRRVLCSGVALALTRAAPASAALLPTPRQTTGPFYPVELPLDADADLVRVEGRAAQASGTILHLTGRVIDVQGRAVHGARVEIWQCDAFGHYHHPGDRGGRADPDFQGFGSTVSRSDGAYRFRTIEPVPYPGRTPHIHFQIIPPGGAALVTQMYLQGHPLNQRDGLFRRLGRAAQLVSVPLVPAPDLEPDRKAAALSGYFEIVLGGDGTPAAG